MSRDQKFGASNGKDTTLGAAVVTTISEHCGNMYADILERKTLNVVADISLADFFSQNYGWITFWIGLVVKLLIRHYGNSL
jgi:hypothetical protein